MTGLRPGAKVMLARNASTVLGIVREATTVGVESGYIVDTARDVRFVPDGQLVEIPADALMLRPGDLVRVNADAPEHAGQCGTVAGPEMRGALFGYWLHIEGVRAWIPCGALTVLTLAIDGGEQQ